MFFDRRLWAFTRGVRWRFAAALVIGLAATITGIGRLALLGWLLAQAFAGAPVDELILPIMAVAVVMALRAVFEYLRAMVAHKTAAHIQRHLRKALYDQVVALGPAYLSGERTGDVVLTMVDGVEQLETFFGQYLPQLVIAFLTPFGVFAFVAFLDFPVALTLLGFTIFTLIAPAAFQAWDRRAALTQRLTYGNFGAEFLDAIQGLATLKAFGQSAARGKALAKRARALSRSTMWVLGINSLSRGITDVGVAVGAAVTLAYGALRVGSGEMSLVALLMILMMGIEVFRPLRDLRALLHTGMVGRAAAEGLFKLLAVKPAVTSPVDAVEDEIAPTVTFEGVGFAYPGGRDPAHVDLSLTIKAGERVGIVGPSGSGKSTVVRLLLRLYDPQHGRILLGGHDLRALPLARLRDQLAVVNQDTYLFHGTVEDNLRFGKAEASQPDIEAAARAANAHTFISALPEGYQTVIGERGLRLSGGQRQRIAIARALLRDAPILILDEALSSVDAENEAVIQEALDRLMEGRTTLILAHRLSSVIDADRILVLDHGQVAESGTHEALMAGGGIYHDLMAEQAQDRRGPGDSDLVPWENRAEDAAAIPATAAMEPSDAILRAEGMGWVAAAGSLLAMIAPWRIRLGITFSLGVTRVAALIGVSVLSALAVAALRSGEPTAPLLTALILVAPLAGVLHWLEAWAAHDMAYRLLAEIRVNLFKKLDQLAPAYLLARRSGDLVAMATQDVEMVEYFFAHTVTPAFVAVLVPATVMVTLILFGWPTAVALAPFLAIVGLSPFLLRRRLDDLASRAREALGDLNAHAVDSVQGVGEIIAFGRADARGQDFLRRIDKYHRARLPFHRDLATQTALLELATGLGGLAVVVTGTSLASRGALDSGILPLLSLLAMAAFLPISEIAQVGRQLADTLGATRRLHGVSREVPSVADGPGVAVSPDPHQGLSLELEDVSFAYAGANRGALRGVSLEAEAGSTVALVGPSGAGKTTVAHLLMRFWDPDTGVVRLNGADLRQFGLEELRQQIALVTQDTYLFNTSLAENIRIARPQASDDEVMAAVERAALGPFVAALPDGVDTAVGERGVQLSGGQRQRVAIARAFLKDAPVLILDEATSHLDAASERAVHAALGALMQARTTVVIAHRLSTIRNADKIVVLDQGSVAETGTHGQLLAQGGLYAHLVARQLTVAAAAD